MKSATERRDAWFGFALMLPALVIFLVAIAYPLVFGVSRSFYKVNKFTLDSQWVGLDNYRAELTGDTATFFNNAKLSIVFAVGTTAMQVVLGVLVALVLNRRFAGRSAARALAIFPYMVPIVVAVLVWKWMLDDQRGVVNQAIQGLGLHDGPIIWFGDKLAMFSVISIGAWRYFPFIVLLVLARLQSVPSALYDAARVDGASAWSRFWDVTMPQIRSVLAVTVALRLIWEFNDFDLIALATGGGPAESTETLALSVYHTTFVGAGIGRGAALASMMLVIVLVAGGLVALLSRQVVRRRGRLLASAPLAADGPIGHGLDAAPREAAR